MQREMPAKGYTKANGTRGPRKEWGEKVYVQLRNGMCPPEPWPVHTTRWVHDGTAGDVVAIKRAE
jgi:hypothetical protein